MWYVIVTFSGHTHIMFCGLVYDCCISWSYSLKVSWVGMWYVSVAFPGHTHLKSCVLVCGCDIS